MTELQILNTREQDLIIKLADLNDKMEVKMIKDRLVVKGEMTELTLREFATMRDGSIVVKVANNQGDTFWIDIKGLEIIAI